MKTLHWNFINLCGLFEVELNEVVPSSGTDRQTPTHTHSLTTVTLRHMRAERLIIPQYYRLLRSDMYVINFFLLRS